MVASCAPHFLSTTHADLCHGRHPGTMSASTLLFSQQARRPPRWCQCPRTMDRPRPLADARPLLSRPHARASPGGSGERGPAAFERSRPAGPPAISPPLELLCRVKEAPQRHLAGTRSDHAMQSFFTRGLATSSPRPPPRSRKSLGLICAGIVYSPRTHGSPTTHHIADHAMQTQRLIPLPSPVQHRMCDHMCYDKDM